MANPFTAQGLMQPQTWRGRSAAPGGFGMAIADKNAQQARDAQMQEEFKGVMESNDPDQIAAFSFKYPEAAKQAQQSFGIANPSTRGIATMGYGKALQTGNAEQAANQLDLYADQVEAAGGQPTNMRADAISLRDGSMDMNTLEMGVAMTEPELWGRVSEFRKSQQSKPEKFEQGTGEMTGYSFNESTGEFSISPDVKQRIENIKAKPTLDVKDRQSINKDFTQLTKDTKLIKNTAKDLEKLSTIKSGPASIAMVFKFMKALDPTSVVREGEFATAENSAGIPEALRNTYNKLMEGGRLGPQQVQQFVGTAKELANSAIDSSETEVSDFIGTFEDTLPKSFKSALMKRIPKKFEISKPKSSTDDKTTTNSAGNPDVPEQAQFAEGMTATGPNGEVATFINGQWVVK